VNEHPHAADRQFTAGELLTIFEVLEVAVQTEGFIDTSSSGGASPEEHAEILASMRQVLAKANELHRRITASGGGHRWLIWPLDEAGNEIASVSAFWAVSAAEVLTQTTGMAVTECSDFVGWKVIQVRTQLDAAEAGESAV
jgi:hypothetical protein